MKDLLRDDNLDRLFYLQRLVVMKEIECKEMIREFMFYTYILMSVSVLLVYIFLVLNLDNCLMFSSILILFLYLVMCDKYEEKIQERSSRRGDR